MIDQIERPADAADPTYPDAERCAQTLEACEDDLLTEAQFVRWQGQEIERLQVGIELIEAENADLLTRLDLESGTVGMIARECADLRRQLDECSQMLARQAAAIRERDELRRQLDECSQMLARQAATIRDLESKLRSADAAERSINEALNSGDGSYRP